MSTSRFETYNVGSDDQINVKDIADIVVRALNLKKVRFTLTGGVDDGGGWGGDVKNASGHEQDQGIGLESNFEQ